MYNPSSTYLQASARQIKIMKIDITKKQINELKKLLDDEEKQEYLTYVDGMIIVLNKLGILKEITK